MSMRQAHQDAMPTTSPRGGGRRAASSTTRHEGLVIHRFGEGLFVVELGDESGGQPALPHLAPRIVPVISSGCALALDVSAMPASSLGTVAGVARSIGSQCTDDGRWCLVVGAREHARRLAAMTGGHVATFTSVADAIQAYRFAELGIGPGWLVRGTAGDRPVRASASRRPAPQHRNHAGRAGRAGRAARLDGPASQSPVDHTGKVSRPGRSARDQRVCATAGCDVRLSMYNPDDRCVLHSETERTGLLASDLC